MMCKLYTDTGGIKQIYHVCPPVHKIIHSLKLVDFLKVQADNPWYNHYMTVYLQGSVQGLNEPAHKILFLKGQQSLGQAWTNEMWHAISKNVTFWQVLTQTSLCSLLISLETPNDVQSVANNRILKRLAKALIGLWVCTGWSEALLSAHTTLLEISCRGSMCNFVRTLIAHTQKVVTWMIDAQTQKPWAWVLSCS